MPFTYCKSLEQLRSISAPPMSRDLFAFPVGQHHDQMDTRKT